MNLMAKKIKMKPRLYCRLHYERTDMMKNRNKLTKYGLIFSFLILFVSCVSKPKFKMEDYKKTEIETKTDYNADTDGDGIKDYKDKCPYEYETFNGYQDADGCPDEDPYPVAAVSESIGPVITIFEPAINRGIKIERLNKQILVRGKAVDDSGIKAVFLNKSKIKFKYDGTFEENIELLNGDNEVKIKAIDNVGNASEISFIVSCKEKDVKENYEANKPNYTNNKEKRLALIIGNANYNTAGQKLINPVNDANLMENTLKDLGFEVIKRTDSDKQSLERAIKEFSKKIPKYNITLFYYAGHGVQVDGMNYIIPVDAKLEEKSDCKFEAVPVNFVVEEFEKYPDNTNIVILDACRNNPFRSWARGSSEGFKAIAPSSGTIIAFATSEGATAADGYGQNGLFTQVLSKQMKEPQPIESVFKKTRIEVEKLSNYNQSPQEWTKLKGDFWFKK
jgi:hypothetical protein